MRKSNKKGFTLLELVIVIAVIAILSAVLIPTFGGITEKAKNSARDQEAKNAYTNYIIEAGANAKTAGYIKVGEYYYEIDDSQIKLDTESTATPSGVVLNTCEHTGVEEGKVCGSCGVTVPVVEEEETPVTPTP